MIRQPFIELTVGGLAVAIVSVRLIPESAAAAVNNKAPYASQTTGPVQTIFCGPAQSGHLLCEKPATRTTITVLDCTQNTNTNAAVVTCGGTVYSLKSPIPEIASAASTGSSPAAGPHASVTATSQGSTASVKYTLGLDSYPFRSLNPFISDSLSVTASAPISKTGDTTTLASQNGLANAAALDLEWQRLIGYSNDSDATRTMTFGGYLKPAYQQYTYVAASALPSEAALTTSLAKANRTTGKIPIAVGAYFGMTVLGPDMLFVHYDHQKAYQDQTSGAVCPASASGSTTPITCATGPVGAPKSTEKSLVSVEYKYFSNNSRLPFAVDFHPIYDTRSHIKSIDVPIFFVNDGKASELVGGIDIGWNSSNKKFTYGLVISTPFSLLQPGN